jgi:hypothetical protein
VWRGGGGREKKVFDDFLKLFFSTPLDPRLCLKFMFTGYLITGKGSSLSKKR